MLIVVTNCNQIEFSNVIDSLSINKLIPNSNIKDARADDNKVDFGIEPNQESDQHLNNEHASFEQTLDQQIFNQSALASKPLIDFLEGSEVDTLQSLMAVNLRPEHKAASATSLNESSAATKQNINLQTQMLMLGKQESLIQTDSLHSLHSVKSSGLEQNESLHFNTQTFSGLEQNKTENVIFQNGFNIQGDLEIPHNVKSITPTSHLNSILPTESVKAFLQTSPDLKPQHDVKMQLLKSEGVIMASKEPLKSISPLSKATEKPINISLFSASDYTMANLSNKADDITQHTFKAELNSPFQKEISFTTAKFSESFNSVSALVSPILSDTTDIPVMQITQTGAEKSSNANPPAPAMTNLSFHAAARLEQQASVTLQHLVSNNDFTDVKIKDKQLGDIHFSVAGKHKEHLGVFITQSQTVNLVQTHFTEIQQELGEEGVTDFEMFSSKEEQEQQKREYLANKTFSLEPTEEEIEAAKLPNIHVSLLGNLHNSSINISV